MTSKDKIDLALNRFHFYSGINWDLLQTSDQEKLLKHSKTITLKRKKILFSQESYPSGVYVLTKGKLKAYQLNYDGTVQILFIFSVNEVFGYRPIISDEYQPVSIAAIEDCELLFIDRKIFLDLLKSSLTLSNQLLKSLCHEFTVLTNRINVFAQRGIKERLALAILILNKKYQSPENPEEFAEIKLTRKDLANFVGTSNENLSRTLNYFKEKKLIRTNGKSIFIENYKTLFILSAIA